MIERLLTPDNILDRLEWLERRLAELEAGAVTVQVVEVPDKGASSVINGWVATGSTFQDLLGRIVLDSSLPGIRLAPGGIIYSSDYQPGVSGFKIDGGTAEFNDVTVRGTVYANAGNIAGWHILPDRITATNIRLYSGAANTARVEVGTGSDANTAGVNSAASSSDIAFWAGATHANRASAPFRVTVAGALTATNATVTGTIYASAGYISGSLTVGTSDPRIVLDGANKRIRTSTYTAGLQGFSLDGATGEAEFNNITVRGALRASTFLYGQIFATGGTLVIAKATGRLYADCTTASSFNVDIADPDGVSHSAAGGLWAVNDIIRLKDPLVGDVWAKITAKTDMSTYWRLTVSLQSGPSGVTFRKGMAVVNYGQSGQGVLWLTADDANAPYYSVRIHAGAPWSAMTEIARLGNLSGNWGYTSATYGIALGEYASGKANLTWDPTNGLRLRTYDTTVLQLDNSGGAYITGTLKLSSNGKIMTEDGKVELDKDSLIFNTTLGETAFIMFYRNGYLYGKIGGMMLGLQGIVIGINAKALSSTASSCVWIQASNDWAQKGAELCVISGSSYEPSRIYATGYIYGTKPIGCFVYRSTEQSIPDATVTPLSWDTEVDDNGGCWSSDYPDRLVAPVDGWYMVGGGWARNSTNNPNASRHWVAIAVYDSSGALQYYAAANEIHTIANKNVNVSVSGRVYLPAGWFVKIVAYQDSGATRNTHASSSLYRYHNYGWMFRIA